MLRALRSLLLPAQLDGGCSGSRLYLDAVNSGSLFYLEDWTNPADLERELRSARFTRLLSVMEGAPQRPGLDFHFISQTRGLDYVEEVRLFGEHGQRLPPSRGLVL